MGDRDYTVIGTRAGNVADIEVAARDVIGTSRQRDADEDERKRARKILGELTGGRREDIPGAAAVKFENDVVAHRGYPDGVRPEWRAGVGRRRSG